MWDRLRRGRHFLLAGLTIVLVMASLASRSRWEHLTAQLAKETQQTDELKSRVQLLQSRVVQYSSVREVAPRAERDLGLTRPQPDRVHVLHFASPPENHTWVSEAYAGKTSGSNP